VRGARGPQRKRENGVFWKRVEFLWRKQGEIEKKINASLRGEGTQNHRWPHAAADPASDKVKRAKAVGEVGRDPSGRLSCGWEEADPWFSDGVGRR